MRVSSLRYSSDQAIMGCPEIAFENCHAERAPLRPHLGGARQHLVSNQGVRAARPAFQSSRQFSRTPLSLGPRHDVNSDTTDTSRSVRASASLTSVNGKAVESGQFRWVASSNSLNKTPAVVASYIGTWTASSERSVPYTRREASFPMASGPEGPPETFRVAPKQRAIDRPSRPRSRGVPDRRQGVEPAFSLPERQTLGQSRRRFGGIRLPRSSTAQANGHKSRANRQAVVRRHDTSLSVHRRAARLPPRVCRLHRSPWSSFQPSVLRGSAMMLISPFNNPRSLSCLAVSIRAIGAESISPAEGADVNRHEPL